MPYNVQWHDNAETMIRLDMYDDVTWDGWYVAVEDLCEKLSQVTHRVDVILHDTTGMPKGNPMPHLRSSINRFNQHANLGIVVLVSARSTSFLAKTMLDVVSRVTAMANGQSSIIAHSLDEAIATIMKDREEQTA